MVHGRSREVHGWSTGGHGRGGPRRTYACGHEVEQRRLRRVEKVHHADGGAEAELVRHEVGQKVGRGGIEALAAVEAQHERDEDARDDDVAKPEHRHRDRLDLRAHDGHALRVPMRDRARAHAPTRAPLEHPDETQGSKAAKRSVGKHQLRKRAYIERLREQNLDGRVEALGDGDHHFGAKDPCGGGASERARGAHHRP